VRDMNEVSEHDSFSDAMKACSWVEREWVEVVKNLLRENLLVGDPLRYSWFREKRLKGRRVYFVINESTKKALFVAIGGKKGKQQIINHIIAYKEEYLDELA